MFNIRRDVITKTQFLVSDAGRTPTWSTQWCVYSLYAAWEQQKHQQHSVSSRTTDLWSSECVSFVDSHITLWTRCDGHGLTNTLRRTRCDGFVRRPINCVKSNCRWAINSETTQRPVAMAERHFDRNRRKENREEWEKEEVTGWVDIGPLCIVGANKNVKRRTVNWRPRIVIVQYDGVPHNTVIYSEDVMISIRCGYWLWILNIDCNDTH